MATHLAINDSLLHQAIEVSGRRTKKAVVTQALAEYVQKRQRAKVAGLFGSVQYNPAYELLCGIKSPARLSTWRPALGGQH